MNISHPNGPVVVGVDGSQAALDAVRFGIHEARERRTSLRLVHVITPHPQSDTVYGAPDVDGDYGRDVLHEAVRVATEQEHGVLVESTALHGQPEEVLLTEARASCLLVLGTTMGSAVAARVLGSVVFSLIESSPNPVAVIRGSENVQGAVVVALGSAPVDGADVVVAEAFREASMRSTSLLAVHSLALTSVLAHSVTGSPDILHPESVTDTRLDSIGVDHPDVHVASVHAEADAGFELIEVSRTAQLLILGHEQNRASGTTLTKVLRQAHCPVLVVPHA